MAYLRSTDQHGGSMTMPSRILLADDHLIVRQGLKALLEHEGFAVVAEVGDGQEAVRVSRERRPDVVVLDFAMPLLNGLGAAGEILRLVAEGKSTKEIAKLQGISFKTAESHRTRIMRKTNIHGTAGLVRYAVRRGLIQL